MLFKLSFLLTVLINMVISLFGFSLTNNLYSEVDGSNKIGLLVLSATSIAKLYLRMTAIERSELCPSHCCILST